jgi:hypothetical protein
VIEEAKSLYDEELTPALLTTAKDAGMNLAIYIVPIFYSE